MLFIRETIENRKETIETISHNSSKAKGYIALPLAELESVTVSPNSIR